MTISEELDELHRDCMGRLNAMHWACVDMTMSLELIAEELNEMSTNSTDLCTFDGMVTSTPEAYNILGHLSAATFTMGLPWHVSGTPFKGVIPIIATCYGPLAEEVTSPLGLALGDRVKITGELLATGEITQVIAATVGFADDQVTEEAAVMNLFD